MRKKILSWILASAIVLSLFSAMPFTAGAEPVYVCQVGATRYETLGAAITAVPNDNTIVLLADIAYTSTIEASAKSFIIDLAGHNLSVATVDIYSLRAANGKTLSIVNSAGSPSSLNIQMTSSTYYGAVSATLNGNIVISPDVQTTVLSNVSGIYAGDGGHVTVGDGMVTANSACIEVTYSGSVVFDGDVTTTSNRGYGLSTGGYNGTPGCSIDFTGNVYSNYTGVSAGQYSDITVVGNIVDTGGFGVNAGYAGTVDVTGSVTGVAYGTYTMGGEIRVTGDVNITGVGSGCVGAYAMDMVTDYAPRQNGSIEIDGSLTGYQYGARADTGGSITVTGDVVSLIDRAGYTGAAVYAGGLGSTVSVGGDAIAQGQGCSGIEFYDGGAVTVAGNVSAVKANCYGVKASSTANGSTATIDGTISAPTYLLFGTEVKTIANTTMPSTLTGYRMYTGGTPVSTVYVKEQAATPSANPVGGVVPPATGVGLSTITANAAIYYTTDGSVPTTGSTLYVGAIPIQHDMTIKAIAVKDGMNQSEVMSETYSMIVKLATPTATPSGGAVASGTMVSLSTASSGAEIHYTTDGSDPSGIGILYTTPIEVTGPMTIKAVAVKEGMVDSDIMAEDYTVIGKAATPTATPSPGVVAIGTTVSLSTATDGAVIYYTVDGAAPTSERTRYTTPIRVGGPMTIKAIAVKDGMTVSDIMSATYSLTEQAATPSASPKGGVVTSGTEVTLSTATAGAEIRYTTDGSQPTGESTRYAAPIAVTGAVTIKAIAVKEGMTDSGVMSETYTIRQVTGSSGSDSPSYYWVTATAGEGGSITPSGKVSVKEFGEVTFEVKASDGFRIEDVLVDGVSVGSVAQYTFTSVKKSHTISAKFTHDCPSRLFVDVDPSLWYHEGIDFVLSHGLFKGISSDTFEPDTAMTRAMMATVLCRFDGAAAPGTENLFSDVPEDAWYTDAVLWGANVGMLQGYDGLFGPDDITTKEQFAVMLFRYAVYKRYDVTVGQDTNILSYQDAFAVSEYAIPAIQWACGSGLLKGDTNGNLMPQAPVTRAEASVMLMRFYELYVKQ